MALMGGACVSSVGHGMNVSCMQFVTNSAKLGCWSELCSTHCSAVQLLNYRGNAEEIDHLLSKSLVPGSLQQV